MITKRRCRGSRRAFTLVEILIAVALMAVLLTAMCAAVAATVDSCQVNQSYAESSGHAKLALGQIAASVRKANTLVLTSATRLDLVDENSNAVDFTYDTASKQLRYEHGSPLISSALAHNVNAVKFTAESAPDPQTLVVRIVRVTLSITLNAPDGGNGPGQQTYTISAAPRRARSYQ